MVEALSVMLVVDANESQSQSSPRGTAVGSELAEQAPTVPKSWKKSCLSQTARFATCNALVLAGVDSSPPDSRTAAAPSLSANEDLHGAARQCRFCRKQLGDWQEIRNRGSARYPQWRCRNCHSAYNRLHAVATTPDAKQALTILKKSLELLAMEVRK